MRAVGRLLRFGLSLGLLAAIAAGAPTGSLAGAGDEVGTPTVAPGAVLGYADGLFWLDDERVVTTCNLSGNRLCVWTDAGMIDAYPASIDPFADPGQIALSPDRTRIAFFGGHLKVASVDGTNVQTIDAQSWISNCCLVWSDDSLTVYYQDSFGAIRAVNVITQARTQLTANETWRTVLDQRGGVLLQNDFIHGPSWELYEQSTAGGSATDMLRRAYQERFSPDGTLVAYTSATDGRVHIMNVDGSGDIAVSQSGLSAVRPSWRPDGGMVTFGDTAGGVWTVRPNGSDLRQIFVLPAGEAFRSSGWSAIGTRFAFSSTDESAHSRLYFASATEVIVSDATPPDVSCASLPVAWSEPNVSIACVASDTGSGLADAGDANFSLTTSVAAGTEDAAAFTSSRQVCDRAGNCVPAGPLGPVPVDRKTPTLTIAVPTGGTYVLGESVLASYGCADGGSGVASCAGPLASGSAIDTGSVGTKNFPVSGVDAVGNTTSAIAGYTVTYAICPLSDTSKPKKNKAKVQFALCNATGADVSAASVSVAATAVDATPLSPSQAFAFNPHLASSGGYALDLDVSTLAAGAHTLRFTATGDPLAHTVSFQVK